MKSNEILERVFFADVSRSRMQRKYNYNNGEDPKGDEVVKIVRVSNEEAENLSLEEIRKKIKEHPPHLFWLKLYAGKCCKRVKVNPNELCIGESHHNCLNSIKEPRGTKLIDYLNRNRNNSEVQRRTKFVIENWGLLNSTSWVVINEIEGSVEVMSGNHRVMVACDKGLDEIEVLQVCDEDDPEKCTELVLNL